MRPSEARLPYFIFPFAELGGKEAPDRPEMCPFVPGKVLCWEVSLSLGMTGTIHQGLTLTTQSVMICHETKV